MLSRRVSKNNAKENQEDCAKNWGWCLLGKTLKTLDMQTCLPGNWRKSQWVAFEGMMHVQLALLPWGQFKYRHFNQNDVERLRPMDSNEKIKVKMFRISRNSNFFWRQGFM